METPNYTEPYSHVAPKRSQITQDMERCLRAILDHELFMEPVRRKERHLSFPRAMAGYTGVWLQTCSSYCP